MSSENADAPKCRAADPAARLCRQLPLGRLLGGDPETDRDERLKQALVHVEYSFKDLPVEELEAEGKQRLQKAGCPKPFHWPLEFPEVFMERGGFDAIVGNPPFMGGQKITGNLGMRLS